MKKGRRTIPEIRAELVRIAQEISHLSKPHAQEILALSEETKRVSTTRRTPRQRAPAITDELVQTVRAYAAKSDESLWEIGVRFGLNQGRVSEILNGFR